MRVLRRFPWYDFMFATERSVAAASSELEAFLNRQERPRGFVLSDPRAFGKVYGATFTFRRRESGFGGRVSPYVEGHFVPAGSGAEVFVRVQMPILWWLFGAVAFTGFLISLEWPVTFTEVLGLSFFGTSFVLLSIAPCWFEGWYVARLLRKILGEKTAA